jgi:uncharacterized protein YbjT (DUF2867 family)
VADSSTKPEPTRSAWLAGATGLVGRALLDLLLVSPHYARVHLLLRREVQGLPANPKLQTHLVDFDRLPQLPPADDVFIALGTTIKTAGSEAAFRRVDFDAVVNTARAGRAAGAKRLLIVSALGADAGSRVFYNRVKGEMERTVSEIGYDSLVLVQPSLLVGDRSALGQPVRAGEEWTMRLLGPVIGWVPRAIRPIEADTVAGAMLYAALHAEPGKRVIKSGEMQTMGR